MVRCLVRLDIPQSNEDHIIKDDHMSVQFEWQARNDNGQWEIVAQTQRPLLLRWLGLVPHWAWYVLLGVAVAVLVTGSLYLRHRYAEAERQLAGQLQSVIDLEARAFAQSDADLFLELQDTASQLWYEEQAQRIQDSCGARRADTNALLDPCAPVLPAEVQNVELRQDIAWVEVIEGLTPVRRVRFYRQTDRGWKHTTPRVEFWRTPIELRYGDLIFRYHRRDQPHVEPLIEHVARVVRDVCPSRECMLGDVSEVNFAADFTSGPVMQLGEHGLLLPSPWLLGIPVDGTWDESRLTALMQQVAAALVHGEASL